MPHTTHHTVSWHTLSIDTVLTQLNTSLAQGIPQSEATIRLEKYGHNRLQGGTKVSPWRLLLAQFQNVLVIILLMATALSGFLGETVEAITIAAIVLLAVVLGFVQEYRAERAMEALKKIAAPTAKVIRDGVQKEIPADQLVPGD